MKAYFEESAKSIRAYFEDWADDIRFITRKIKVAWSR